MRIVDLPESIFRSLNTFISNDDYRCFLNTSKEYFSSVKRHAIYFSLNSEKSFLYVLDLSFQELLLDKVENGWKQIGLNFEFDIPLIPHNLPLHKIVSETSAISVDRLIGLNAEIVQGVQNVREMPNIPNIRQLKIYKSQDFKDVSNLSHLSSLSIIGESVIEDIRPLENIEELWLGGCPFVKDYSKFNGSKQKILCLKNCPNLTNVVNFAGIRTLELSHCDHLVDVSPLRGIYDLSLSHCRYVSDISGLGGHHRICLRFLDNDILTGTEVLLHIPHVELTFSPIADLNDLRFAKVVKLYKCQRIVDVSPLKNAKTVVLDGGYDLKDLTPLQHVPELEIISHLIRPTTLTKMKNNSITFIDCSFKDLKNTDVFSNFKHLRIFNNITIVNLINKRKIEGLLSLQSLELQFCEKLTNVDGLGDIPTIKLISCHNLIDISGLGRNHHVLLRSCSALKDVKSLATVPIVTIVECDKVRDYKYLANVPRLKVIMR